MKTMKKLQCCISTNRAVIQSTFGNSSTEMSPPSAPLREGEKEDLYIFLDDHK